MSGGLPPVAAGAGPIDAPPSLADRLRGWRAALVANPAFRRFAARNLLTRPVARRQTAALFDLSAGFVYSQILFAFVRLRLPELLATGPQDAAAIAAATGLPEQGAERLLRAAVALRLAERRSGGRFGLGMLGAALVGNEGVRAMIEHHALLYADLGDPVGLLRGRRDTRLAAFWNYRDADPAEAEAYSRLMAASQDFIATEVLDALPLRGRRCLLDVGGGTGAFVEAVARRHPELRLKLFDLPPVAENARRRLAAAGLGDRIEIVAGSFKDDSLPAGADVITLVRVLHDHDDEAARSLLAAARRALPPGGMLVVAEPMAATPGAERAGDAYFGFYLMAMASGRPRSRDEIAAMIEAAGFRRPRALATATPLLASVLVAAA